MPERPRDLELLSGSKGLDRRRGLPGSDARLEVNGRGTHVRSAATDGLFSQGEPVAVADIREAIVIKEGNLFLMADCDGNLPPGEDRGYGLYLGDTRYLSVYDLSFGDVRPTALLSTAEMGFSSEHHLTNPPMTVAEGRLIPKETLEVRRQRVIDGSLQETVQITNFNVFPITVQLRFEFAADFLDIFEFRGQKRLRRGTLRPPVVEDRQVVFSYDGLDDVQRKTSIRFSRPAERIWESGALFAVSLGHRESQTLNITVAVDDQPADGPVPVVFESLAEAHRDWLASCTRVYTDNEFFNAMLARSLSDIRVLAVADESGDFIAAGTPWFSSLFGRDSLITAFQMLAFNPAIARDSLRVLAASQGTEVDDWRDEEPGKILHELRVGEMANTGEIPMVPYYGSVDSTPLFLMLAAEYVSWTGDLDIIRELEPNLMKALEWIDARIAHDGNRYLSYSQRSSKGLHNQGWKDSRDGIVNGDGTLVAPPVALAEVQGYVYAAYRGLARLLSALHDDEMGKELRRKASELKDAFDGDFWLEEEGYLAMALGGEGKRASAISSNPGHCLWTGIVDRRHAGRIATRMFANDMFSGWGIRTLSSGSTRYNPLGYHIGSVWPHDNSLIGMGLKRYGFEQELDELATAMYDSSRAFEYYRLPELFSGAPRTAHGVPVSYPVACRPQAWAAGAIPLLLQAILGLAPDAAKNELRIVRPRLPYWLGEVEVQGLRLGDSAIDLAYTRRRGQTRVSVIAARGVRVVRTQKWPL